MNTRNMAGTNQKGGTSSHLPGDTLYKVPAPAEATTKARTDNGAGGQDVKQHAHLDTTEAADYLRLSRSCLAKWRCAGGGPEYILAGRKVLYARAVLDAWLASRSRHNTSERA